MSENIKLEPEKKRSKVVQNENNIVEDSDKSDERKDDFSSKQDSIYLGR